MPADVEPSRTAGIERHACPACGAAGAAAFVEAEWRAWARGCGTAPARMEAAIAADPRLSFGTMLRCPGCGTMFTARVPDGAALGDFYRTYYGNDGYRGKLKRKLGFERRRLLALRLLARGRRFLDVGCNIGCAVEAARFWGMEATGLELDPDAIAIAKDLFPRNRFLVGTLEALPAGERFGLVMCTEVVEHVPDPEAFLHDLAGVVAPGGLLFLTTPNAACADALADPMRWQEMKPPEHQTLFSRAGLGALLRRHFASARFVPNRKGGNQVLARRA